MNKGVEHEIRERAYGLWVLSGMIDGQADAHWLSAEAAIHAEAADVRKPAAKVAPAGKTTKTVSKTSGKTTSKTAAKSTAALAKASAATVRKPKASAAASLGAGA